MPLQDGVLLGMKDGVVELTATVIEPTRDSPQSFLEAVNGAIFQHQYQLMTDPAILDPADLDVATCVVCRDTLPEPLKDALLSLGFAPVDSEGGGRDQSSMFDRFSRGKRAKLDKWRTPYLRAKDLSERMGAWEEALIDEVPEGPLEAICADAARVLADATRTHLRVLVAPSLDGLKQLERQFLQERARAKGRLILHPLAVRALACFTAATLEELAPYIEWTDEDDAPLWVTTEAGSTVRTDPAYRVVKLVARGNRELLSSYVQTVLAEEN